MQTRPQNFLTAVALVVYAGAQVDARADFSFSGISEKHFNAIQGEFTARLRDATIATGPDAVSIYINDKRLDDELVTVRDKSITVSCHFSDGVNDILIEALADDGVRLRGDALLWAGGNTLVVDVVDSDMLPVEGATVSVSLSSNTAISVRAATVGGAARFDNLPALPMIITARTKDGEEASQSTLGDAGSQLLTVAPAKER